MATIKEYYERYWDEPETYNDPTTPQRIALLRRHLADLPVGTRVLDAGCGRGEFCALFRSMGFRPEGIDISDRVIGFARSAHHDIPFHAGEVQTLLPANAGRFDCVFTSEVIEHLFDVGTYLDALHALLKPAGRLIVTTPYHGLVKNIVLDICNFASHYDPLGQHIRFFDKRSLNRCLELSGFSPTVWSGYGRPWPFWKSFFVVATRDARLAVPASRQPPLQSGTPEFA